MRKIEEKEEKDEENTLKGWSRRLLIPDEEPTEKAVEG